MERSVAQPAQATANQESLPQSLSWHDYIYEFEIERKVKDVFDMFCGGYSQNLALIAFIEIV